MVGLKHEAGQQKLEQMTGDMVRFHSVSPL